MFTFDQTSLGGVFKYFLEFSPLFGEDEPILTVAYFSDGLVQQIGSTTNIPDLTLNHLHL